MEPEAVSMADGVIMLLGFLALTCMIGVAGLLYGQQHRRPAAPFHWADAEHQHALIMSRYYANYGPTQ